MVVTFYRGGLIKWPISTATRVMLNVCHSFDMLFGMVVCSSDEQCIVFEKTPTVNINVY